ncbi:MAG: hypothetical protein ACLSV2_06065 [Clostridium sp.]
MTKRNDASILIQDTMDRLGEIGIHSILVKSKEEAKNFIMYHIDIGTEVRIDDCLELKNLNIEKAIVEKGGTILNNKEGSLESKEISKRKPTISKLNLHGSSYIFRDFNTFTHYNMENNHLLNYIGGKKAIIVINKCFDDIFYDKLLSIYKKIDDIGNKITNRIKSNTTDKVNNISCLDMHQKNIGQNSINNDISIVFIE